MTVRISVVTPSYNQAAFLERTLRSVPDQRDQVHEYFVLDGGSDDGSREIIERHAGAIDWWVSEPDAGQAAAIRRGFERATGDVLCWLNSDDVLLPGALARVREVFARRPHPDVVTGWGVAIDADDRVVKVFRRPHDAPWRARLGYVRVIQPCCFFRRALYESVGGIDPNLHCALDTELWYRFFGATRRWSGAGAYLAAYRLHDRMKGKTLHDRYRQEWSEIRRRHPEYAAGGMVHGLGRVAYHLSQWASGRRFAEMRDIRRMVGRRCKRE